MGALYPTARAGKLGALKKFSPEECKVVARDSRNDGHRAENVTHKKEIKKNASLTFYMKNNIRRRLRTKHCEKRKGWYGKRQVAGATHFFFLL